MKRILAVALAAVLPLSCAACAWAGSTSSRASLPPGTSMWPRKTIQEANGGWTNENGTVDHEYTVVILLSDTTPEAVYAAADDLIREFNQNSVLIQANRIKTEFYSG